MLALGLLLTVSWVRAQEGQAQVTQGQRVFAEQGCYGCHTVGRAGTPIASDLSRVGSKYSHAHLTRWLRDPASQRPGAHMPKLDLTEPEVQALAAFLSSLR
ncbi:MAG TPA: cytochrome c [Methylomirabilota bacterium]|nr:cytochrome c [Methylomirabilota bacterium]